jgi:PBSX family phage terminase large subunit
VWSSHRQTREDVLSDVLGRLWAGLPLAAVSEAGEQVTIAPARRVVEHSFVPRGVIREVMADRSPEILVAGPAGTGKSRGILEKLLLVAMKYAGCKILVLRLTSVSLSATGLQTWESFVAKEALAMGAVRFFGGSKREPASYRFANGSRMVVGGLDNPMKIMSSEYDIAYVQEANELEIEHWESITSRLRNGVVPYQQLIGDCNPQEPTHWLKERCDRGATKYYHSTHEENPLYFDEVRGPNGSLAYQVTEAGAAYIAKLDALTGVRYQRLRLGNWVAAEGVVYEQWSPNLIVDRAEIPEQWPRYWVIDFGFVNPMVVQHWAEAPDGELIMYREFYRTGLTVDEFATMVLRSVADIDPDFVPDARAVARGEPLPPKAWRWREPKPRSVIADHDAEGRAMWTKITGLVTTRARKEVLDGIVETQIRLRDARMTFMRDVLAHPVDQSLRDVKKPVRTVEEFPGYVWDTGAGGKIKEEPVKEDDHGMDCVRYLAMARSARFRPGFRSLG